MSLQKEISLYKILQNTYNEYGKLILVLGINHNEIDEEINSGIRNEMYSKPYIWYLGCDIRYKNEYLDKYDILDNNIINTSFEYLNRPSMRLNFLKHVFQMFTDIVFDSSVFKFFPNKNAFVLPYLNTFNTLCLFIREGGHIYIPIYKEDKLFMNNIKDHLSNIHRDSIIINKNHITDSIIHYILNNGTSLGNESNILILDINNDKEINNKVYYLLKNRILKEQMNYEI